MSRHNYGKLCRKACRWWLWTGPKVAAWMSELLGRPVSAQRGGSTWLRYRLRSPRPQHGKLLQEQEAWKKVGATDSQSPSGASRGRRRSLDNGWAPLRACRCCGMWVPGNNRLLRWTGVFSGYCMVCSPSVEKRIGGFCPKLISTCSIGYWQTCQTFWPWRKANHFGDGSSRLAYKFASSSRGYSFGVHASHSELQPAERLSNLLKRSRISYSRRWMTWKRCFFSAAVPYEGSKTWFGAWPATGGP